MDILINKICSNLTSYNVHCTCYNCTWLLKMTLSSTESNMCAYIEYETGS